ncbi:hypothetical protein RRG08_047560 [Elysia crispata]|uniref:Uncharacterized protein n=1 Tax=Elysia crispata TaxID=231223 RepID=A0AAE0YPY7_9GAST|nr:hypothetical protein RRG08_047560 [Elysia crispata]
MNVPFNKGERHFGKDFLPQCVMGRKEAGNGGRGDQIISDKPELNCSQKSRVSGDWREFMVHHFPISGSCSLPLRMRTDACRDRLRNGISCQQKGEEDIRPCRANDIVLDGMEDSRLKMENLMMIDTTHFLLLTSDLCVRKLSYRLFIHRHLSDPKLLHTALVQFPVLLVVCFPQPPTSRPAHSGTFRFKCVLRACIHASLTKIKYNDSKQTFNRELNMLGRNPRETIESRSNEDYESQGWSAHQKLAWSSVLSSICFISHSEKDHMTRSDVVARRPWCDERIKQSSITAILTADALVLMDCRHSNNRRTRRPN